MRREARDKRLLSEAVDRVCENVAALTRAEVRRLLSSIRSSGW
jgi:hypothetical protein